MTETAENPHPNIHLDFALACLLRRLADYQRQFALATVVSPDLGRWEETEAFCISADGQVWLGATTAPTGDWELRLVRGKQQTKALLTPEKIAGMTIGQLYGLLTTLSERVGMSVQQWRENIPEFPIGREVQIRQRPGAYHNPPHLGKKGVIVGKVGLILALHFRVRLHDGREHVYHLTNLQALPHHYAEEGPDYERKTNPPS